MTSPLVPAHVDMGNRPLPLTSWDILDGYLLLTVNDTEHRAMLRLLALAWRQTPAGSLEDYGPAAFSRITRTTRQWWNKHGAAVLSQWVMCDDGRYYHPRLAEAAIKLWNRKAGKPQSVRYMDVCSSDWQALRLSVFERDGYRCHYCGRETSAPHCDHAIPRVMGGMSVMENLVTSCAGCNLSKGPKTIKEWIG